MIRRATPADLPALRVLQGHLPRRAPALLDHAVEADDVLASVAGPAIVTSRRLRSAGGGGQAPPRGVPVGYLLPAVGDGAHVAELVVAPERRREGRARALLDALFESLPAGRRVTLAVDPDNEAALSLYRDVGFETRGRLEGYFDPGAALLLSRTVDGRAGADRSSGAYDS